MKAEMRNAIVGIPVIGPALRKKYGRLSGRQPIVFERSDQYWEDRYRTGGTSVSGSYGRLAEFKADFINRFIQENEVRNIVEFGCGDGAQLESANYPSYIGFDVSSAAVEMCQEKFSHEEHYQFHLADSDAFDALEKVELALSLDVIYHLIEGEVFDSYMTKLFKSAERYVIIFAYDFVKNYNSKHERGRKFTAWIETNAPSWVLVGREKKPYPYDATDPNNTSQSDFFVFAPKD